MSVPVLIERAIQIAWDYLELTGQLDDPEITSRFLLNEIETMVRKGERRQLMLSNLAIITYERTRQETKAA